MRRSKEGATHNNNSNNSSSRGISNNNDNDNSNSHTTYRMKARMRGSKEAAEDVGKENFPASMAKGLSPKGREKKQSL